MQLITKNPRETRKIAAILAKQALASIRAGEISHALVFSLEGNLGAGKTTFTQGFARELGIREKVASPTFVVLKQYAIPMLPRGRKRVSAEIPVSLYHIDCYRVAADDLAALGFKDILSDPAAILIVEWGNRVSDILPKDRITIKFSHHGGDERNIAIETRGI